MYRINPLLALGALIALAACESDAPTVASNLRQPFADEAALVRVPDRTNVLTRELAELKRSTARFHDLRQAKDAAYSTLFMNMCMEDPTGADRGGMGYHWVNTDLLDAELDVSKPEALLYELGPGGNFRLTGVEYVIPGDAWTSSDAPMLMGKELTLNGFGLWALHVWVWKDNPSGLFKDWNPTVSCP